MAESAERVMGLFALDTLAIDHQRDEASDDLAPGVPDLRLPKDQLDALWLGETFAFIDIEVPPMDQRILRRMNNLVWDGLGDRGACFRLSSTRVRVGYLTSGDAPEARSQAIDYARAIVAFYGLPLEALLSCRIGKRENTAPRRVARRGLFVVADPPGRG